MTHAIHWLVAAMLSLAVLRAAAQPPPPPAAADPMAQPVWEPGQTTMFRLPPPNAPPGFEPPTPPIPATLSQETSDFEMQKFIAMIARERVRHLAAPEVVGKLGLRPGMTVVDIGAGVGYFTFDMASAVRPEGKVFATEVDPGMLDRLAAKRDAEGIANVETRLVAAGKLDDFYLDKTFDVAFLCAVFEYLPDPVAFFSALRPRLRPETGRVVIVHPKTLWKFQFEDFYGAPRIFDRLRAGGKSDPAVQRMDPPLRQYLERPPFPGAVAAAPEDLHEAFARGINVILNDPAFPRDVLEHAEKARKSGILDLGVRLREYELVFRWMYCAHHDLFDPPRQPETDEERAAVAMINKALVVPTIVGAPYFGGHCFPRAIALPDQGVVDRMEKAGYRLVRSDDSFNYFYFLEFAPAVEAATDSPAAP